MNWNPFKKESKAIARVEPRIVVKRVAPLQKRNYKASETTNALFGWSTMPMSINSIIRSKLTTLRARSRDQAKSNDYAKRFIGLLKQNTVGHDGIVTTAKSKGIDGKPDRLANDAINKNYKKWSKAKNCSLNGNLSWIDIQNQFIGTIAEDGEILVRKIKGRGEYNYQLQPLDPELLDVGFYNQLSGGNYIRMGIEFNSIGTPVAYWLLTNLENDDVYPVNGKKYQRIPADEIIHAFLPERVGQIRGIPWLATPLARMKMLDGFEDAALVNATAGAKKVMIVETETGNNTEWNDDDDTPETEDDEQIEELESGTVEYLAAGQKMSSFDPTYPSNEFGTFNKSHLRGIAAGLGLSYNLLANDLEGVSFASGRIGVSEDRDGWKCVQKFIIERLCEVVYEEWLRIQLMTGKLLIPTNTGVARPLRLTNFDKFNNVVYRGKRWAYINPLQEANASKVLNELNAKSISQIIREAGEDPEEVFEEIAYEKALFKALGFDIVPTKGSEKDDDDGDIDEEAEDEKQANSNKGEE